MNNRSNEVPCVGLSHAAVVREIVCRLPADRSSLRLLERSLVASQLAPDLISGALLLREALTIARRRLAAPRLVELEYLIEVGMKKRFGPRPQSLLDENLICANEIGPMIREAARSEWLAICCELGARGRRAVDLSCERNSARAMARFWEVFSEVSDRRYALKCAVALP